MRKKLVLALLAVAAVAIVIAGFGAARLYYVASRPDLEVRPADWDWPAGISEEGADRLAAGVLAEMSLEEKVFEMSGQGMSRMIATIILKGYRAVVYAGGNERLKVPPLAFADGPRGIGFAPRATSFPVALARAATWDIDLERQVGEVMGREARAAGVNYFAGLSVNLLRHPSWGRAQESYGEDPWLTGEMGLALMRAVQRHNVMVCAKHFALNSIENSRYDVDVTLSERALREVYLPHFKKLVDGGVESIMSAYNKIRGEYCGHSEELLTTILRQEWGFRGFVSSDWVEGLHDGAQGIRAGMDLEMPSPVHYGERVAEYLDDGLISEGDVDRMVARILRTKILWASREDSEVYSPELLAHPEHAALAREVAEAGAVLLQNGGGVLPFERGAVRRLAVLGELATADNTGDRGSSNVAAPYVVAPLAGLAAHLGDGVEILHADGRDLEKARRHAEAADAVVLVAGFRHGEEGEYIDDDGVSPLSEAEKKSPWTFEGGDRYPLGLKARDLELIDAVAGANERLAVVLIAGSAVTMEDWRQRVPAILLAWYPGMEGGTALARLLFGEVSPSGKLPLTIPRDVAELPFFDPYAREIEYGIYHGYTLFDKEGREAPFPFGFGLSYTTFAFDNLQVLAPVVAPGGTLEVTVDVTNTGARAGAEVAQLYVGFEASAVDRPVKLLRDFAKVDLAPGETRTVALTVPTGELRWYDPEAKQWRLEEMEYGVLVGPSSRPADLLRASFRVAGE